MSVKNDFLKSPRSDAPQNENRKGKDLFMKKKIRLITGFGRHMSKSNVNAFASSSAYFVDHSDYYFIVFPAALDDAAEIRPVKGGVRGHAIADCADDEQPDRVAL